MYSKIIQDNPPWCNGSHGEDGEGVKVLFEGRRESGLGAITTFFEFFDGFSLPVILLKLRSKIYGSIFVIKSN